MFVICAGTDCSRRRNWILTSDPKAEKFQVEVVHLEQSPVSWRV